MKKEQGSSKAENAKAKRSEKAASYFILCFFASFSVFFFVPMDIFLGNAAEIAFPIKPLALFWGLVTLAVFAALFLACVLTRGKANKIVRAIVFGVSVGLYIQGNFLAVNMGLLNGSRYELPLWKAVLNIVIWLVILAAPFFILIKFPDVFENAVSYIPAAIILIQVITLGISAYINIPDYGPFNVVEIFEGDTRWICTAADIDIYSKNKNLIVIIADEYDAALFESTMTDCPDSLSEFDGFTYYADTVGKYTITTPSLGYIFAADGEAKYDNRTFFETVSENYKTNFYCGTIIPPAEVFSKYSDNIILKKITLGDSRGYAFGIYKITFFRCMPEVLKPLFQSNGEIGQELVSNLTDNLDLTDGIPEYSYYNYDFYSIMPRELRSADENVFKFIYLFGVHEPHSITPDFEPLPEYTSIEFEDAAVAVNKLLNEYLKTLKDNGVYDNSEIVIMADHGHYGGKEYPMLMHKPAHQTETGIKISNAPISYDDMFPTLVMLAGGEPNARTIFDIGEDEERVRYFGANNEEITGNIKQDPQ